MRDFNVKVLKPQEVWMAQRLLHEIYVEEQSWVVAPGNPSGLKSTTSRHGLLLCDDYDDNATWLGGFDGARLVGLHRLVHPVAGKFELEHYHDVPAFLTQARAVECNRLALAKDYRRNTPLVAMLLVYEFQYLRAHHYRYAFGATPFPVPGGIYLKIGLKRAATPPFKYADGDENKVELVYFDFRDVSSMRKLQYLSERFLKRRNFGFRP